MKVEHGTRDAEGLNEQEVAEQLGITRGGVWTIERRAIRRLWQEGAKLRNRLKRLEGAGVFR